MEWIAIIIASLIPYGVTIWTYLYPKESLLLGRRGIYKEEPEITESAIKNTKMKAIITIIVYPIDSVGAVCSNVFFILFFSISIKIIISMKSET